MKKALIVDDSRLARTALRRLLTEHGVAADTAESAEVALDYLKHSRPDVVFLDHQMPGIDGFQALEAIKTNPATATIPVMMYTSQEGELYVGQARALGALGVLPKTMQPVEVAKVLRSLHLIPPEPRLTELVRRSAAHATAMEARAAQAEEDAPTELEPLDSERLRAVLGDLFHEHASALREEMRRELQRFAPPAAEEPLVPLTDASRVRGDDARVFKIASAILVVISGVLGYLYFATSTSLDQANARTRSLAASTAALTSNAVSAQPVRLPAAVNGNELDVLEWGLNQGGRYAFGAVPLDDNRAAIFETLFVKLENLGFAGTVTIDVHVGRFCMNYRSDGALELAAPEQPATTCEQVGWPEVEAVALGRQESRGFANAVSIATAQHPALRVETRSYGTSEPLVEYPPTDYELTAGAWNTAATANQRVAVRLIADPFNDSAER